MPSRRLYSPDQISRARIALRKARYLPALAPGELERISEETGVSYHALRAIQGGRYREPKRWAHEASKEHETTADV